MSQNQARTGTYTVANGVATLAIPVQITLNFSLVTPDDTHATFSGDLVATANVQSNAKLVSTAFSDGLISSSQVQRSEVRPDRVHLRQASYHGRRIGVAVAAEYRWERSEQRPRPPPTHHRLWALPSAATAALPGWSRSVKSSSFSDATGSLKDGIYTVTVNPSKVTGATLTGANLPTTFHRLYGDIDGNRTVNSADYFKFKAAFGSTAGQANFNADFDFDGNGKINSSDYFKFKANFGRKFTY